MTIEGYCTYLRFFSACELGITHHSNKEVLTMPIHKRVAYVHSLPYVCDVLWIVTKDYKLQAILRESRDGKFSAVVLSSFDFPSIITAYNHWHTAKRDGELW